MTAAKPSGGPRPGAVALQAAVLTEYFPGLFTNLGIYNPRDVCGNPWPKWKCAPSQHAYGRAIDFGVQPLGDGKGDQLANWLVAFGTAGGGIEDIIWNRRRWTLARGWERYSGRSDHRDHVHVGLTPHAGDNLTRAIISALAEGDDMPDQAYFDDFRTAVQRNDGDIVKRIEALDARLDRIEQAVAQPVPQDLGVVVRQLEPLIELAKKLEE
jgi:hypothetical protein